MSKRGDAGGKKAVKARLLQLEIHLDRFDGTAQLDKPRLGACAVAVAAVARLVSTRHCGCSACDTCRLDA